MHRTRVAYLIGLIGLIGALTACNGNPAQLALSGASSSSSGKSVSASSSSGGSACAAIYRPVCAVEPQQLQCAPTPCASGVYRTYSNQCAADLAKARFIRDGACNELEGEPLSERSAEEPFTCVQQYAPVCAAVNLIQPCATIPCPAREHKTFGNTCEARRAKAVVQTSDECGGLEGKPVTHLGLACTADAPGACAKTLSDSACISAPCLTHSYKTFPNRCEATSALAAVISDSPCGSLQGVRTGGEPPVIPVDNPEGSAKVHVTQAVIKGDLLSLTLGYSGCGPQHFELLVGKTLLKSQPLQAQIAFRAQREEACEAFFMTEFSYDLLPLKQLSGAAHGEIVLPGIGSYRF